MTLRALTTIARLVTQSAHVSPTGEEGVGVEAGVVDNAMMVLTLMAASSMSARTGTLITATLAMRVTVEYLGIFTPCRNAPI